jgi:predicted transcriptional regulator
MRKRSLIRENRKHNENRNEIQIAELGHDNAKSSSNLLCTLRDLISANDPQYPGIDIWYRKKVVPGLLSGERKAYVAFSGEKPIGAAILKRGKSAKFCHVRVAEDYQGTDLGQIFFLHMTMDVVGQSEKIHFTLPESLWAEKCGFFRSFGFSDAAKASHSYRNGDKELSCDAPVTAVFSAVARKLPKLLKRYLLGNYSTSSDILMSVRPKFAERIFGGSKSVEIRKRFSTKWIGHDAVLCATKPLNCLMGRTTIRSVTKGHPDNLWIQFQSQVGCSKNEFDVYVGDASEVAAIEFGDVKPYETPVQVSQLAQMLCRRLLAPQSYFEATFERNSDWKRALYLANLLQRQDARRTLLAKF